MNLILSILAFNIIVIVHELGHFIIAKKTGIKVLEFSLFFGPKIFSIQRGETMYSLRLIPFMAYVKMEGEEEASDSETSFSNKPKYVRALTALGGPLANILLAVVLLTAVFMIEGYSSTEISQVSANSPATEAGLQKGDKIVSYDGKATYLPIDVVQFLYVAKGAPAKVTYVRDGKSYGTTLAPIHHAAASAPKLGVTLGREGTADSNVIKDLSPGMPAEKIGLQVGDRIVELNGQKVSTSTELVGIVEKNGLKLIKLKALRDGAEVSVDIMPQEVKADEWYDAGLAFSQKNGGFIESLGQSAVFTYSIVRSVGYSLGWLFTGKAKLSELMGPIGMVSTMTSVMQQAPNLADMLLYLIKTTAFMSIAIGATNLIPFPMLDGGRITLIGLEAVRGKPLSQEKEAYISMVGFVLIILLGIYAAYNDIVRIVTG